MDCMNPFLQSQLPKTVTIFKILRIQLFKKKYKNAFLKQESLYQNIDVCEQVYHRLSNIMFINIGQSSEIDERVWTE